MLTEHELAKYISNNLRLYLPDEDQNVVCNIVEISRINQGPAVGLKVEVPQSNRVPIVYMDVIKDALADGASREDIMESFVELVQKVKNEPDINLKRVDPSDYNSVKSFLSLMLINTDVNRRMLEDIPHKEIEDLSLITYLNVPERAGLGRGIIKVKRDLLEAWGITEAELFETAEKNEIAANPPVLVGLKDLLENSNPRNYLLDPISKPMKSTDPDMYLLTSKQSAFGASVIINTDVLDRISNMFPDGFCIIPSSIHDVIIVSDSDRKNYGDLREIVRNVNMTSCSPDEILSNNVYSYDQKSKSIQKVKESVLIKEREQPPFTRTAPFKTEFTEDTYKSKDTDIEKV